MTGMSFCQSVMLKNMMDGFQTKTEFEERAAERLRADDGWISQLHCTQCSQHNTSCHPTKKIEKKSPVLAGNTPPPPHTRKHTTYKMTSHRLF